MHAFNAMHNQTTKQARTRIKAHKRLKGAALTRQEPYMNLETIADT